MPIKSNLSLVAALAGAIALAPRTLTAQLTLGDALRRADRAAYENRIAGAAAEAQRALMIGTLKGILPSARFEAGYLRTTDPIGAFGSALRQRSISQASFDPRRLNFPDAIGNHQGAVVLEQPILNADAWIGRRSAAHAAEAAAASAEWATLSTRVEVIRAYYGAVLAVERIATLRSASRAAHAHVSQAEALVKQGLATRSDALLASVRAGEVDAQLADAEGAASNAARGLAVLLGQDPAGSAIPVVASALPSGDRIRDIVGNDTSALLRSQRADVSAALKGLDAARANNRRARSLLVPRVNSFARYDWFSADGPFAANRNWTVGIVASWTPFTNVSDLADMRAAAAGASVARARAEAARASASFELEEARTSLRVALTRLSIAERAVTQSAEAHRIVSRKYEGGLAQVVEVLDAQAVETQSALALSQARWAVIAAAAERRRSVGMDPGTLAALDIAQP
jgi:outer membrane protein TolC